MPSAIIEPMKTTKKERNRRGRNDKKAKAIALNPIAAPATKPVFDYTCAGCGKPAKKSPLKALPNYKDAKITDFGGLGSWHCTGGCKGRVKVTRTKSA